MSSNNGHGHRRALSHGSALSEHSIHVGFVQDVDYIDIKKNPETSHNNRCHKRSVSFSTANVEHHYEKYESESGNNSDDSFLGTSIHSVRAQAVPAPAPPPPRTSPDLQEVSTSISLNHNNIDNKTVDWSRVVLSVQDSLSSNGSTCTFVQTEDDENHEEKFTDNQADDLYFNHNNKYEDENSDTGTVYSVAFQYQDSDDADSIRSFVKLDLNDNDTLDSSAKSGNFIELIDYRLSTQVNEEGSPSIEAVVVNNSENVVNIIQNLNAIDRSTSVDPVPVKISNEKVDFPVGFFHPHPPLQLTEQPSVSSMPNSSIFGPNCDCISPKSSQQKAFTATETLETPASAPKPVKVISYIQAITSMVEYSHLSNEELRYQDYLQGRKVPVNCPPPPRQPLSPLRTTPLSPPKLVSMCTLGDTRTPDNTTHGGIVVDLCDLERHRKPHRSRHHHSDHSSRVSSMSESGRVGQSRDRRSELDGMRPMSESNYSNATNVTQSSSNNSSQSSASQSNLKKKIHANNHYVYRPHHKHQQQPIGSCSEDSFNYIYDSKVSMTGGGSVSTRRREDKDRTRTHHRASRDIDGYWLKENEPLGFWGDISKLVSATISTESEFERQTRRNSLQRPK